MNRTIQRRLFFGGALVLLAVLLAGCGGSKALTVTLAGTPQMNSTDSSPGGNAAVVRIYELASETNFRSVTPEMFWQDGKAALGSELIAPPQQFLLYPDQVTSITIDPTENTKFIGVAADLRQPDLEGWRQILPLEGFKGKQIMVEIGKDRVSINAR